MTRTRTQVFLSFIAGCLLLNSLAILALVADVFVLSHHMFIMGARSTISYCIFAILIAAPPLLGAYLAKLGFTGGAHVSKGTAILLTAAALLVLLFPLAPVVAVVLGSLGVGFHFHL